MLRALRAVDGRLQLKCFTAIEILHLAWLARKPARDTLLALREAAVDAAAVTAGGQARGSVRDDATPPRSLRGRRIAA